ncbi:MAG: error-prone polymerase, partial [Cryptosporangiaceae bacterium]|nr:error-prone polymerase [Cryptosporangiaceae bacterium]
GRTVLQWDKDDCAAAGLVKFDLLGLGMLSAIRYALDFIRAHYRIGVDLAALPLGDPAVYDMLCAADTVGVFQIESRAQMATLPRLRPRTFYDLVVEVALIRPGPIQGGSVHPYIRRRQGLEPVTYPHPLLASALAKTLGVPLFQEQLMQMAIDVAGFTAAEADELRRAIGSKRSAQKMERIKDRLYAGMAERGATGETADLIYRQLSAFAHYGFPESHAISFAAIVFQSSWLKRYYPAAFCAALLKAQPMGFYSPNSLVADARRHGVTVYGPDINLSAAHAGLEPLTAPDGGSAAADPGQPVTGELPASGADPVLDHAVRLGLASVRTIGEDLAGQIITERDRGGPYTGMTGLAARIGLTTPQLEALSTAGAFTSFGLARREALWTAGAASQARPGRLTVVPGTSAPALPGMNEAEIAAADLWATGVAPGSHPIQFVRPRLDELGALSVAALQHAEPGRRILTGGVITHRQRPATAGGVTFMNLEDETGMLNVIVAQTTFIRTRRIIQGSAALLVRGRLQKAEGVISLIAEMVKPLPLEVPTTSRDRR